MADAITTDTLRHRFAAALYAHMWPHQRPWEQADAMERDDAYDQADAVLAVRDAELERLRAEVDRMQEAGDHHIRAAEEQLAEARSWARHGYEIGQRSCTWSDYGVAPKWLTYEPLPSGPPADETPAEAGRIDDAYWAAKDADDADPQTTA